MRVSLDQVLNQDDNPGEVNGRKREAEFAIIGQIVIARHYLGRLVGALVSRRFGFCLGSGRDCLRRRSS
jgi:hypothetical protein